MENNHQPVDKENRILSGYAMEKNHLFLDELNVILSGCAVEKEPPILG